MIDKIVRALKGVLPDATWDFIFEQYTLKKVDFKNPPYEAVMLNKRYMLVRVVQQEKPK